MPPPSPEARRKLGYRPLRACLTVMTAGLAARSGTDQERRARLHRRHALGVRQLGDRGASAAGKKAPARQKTRRSWRTFPLMSGSRLARSWRRKRSEEKANWIELRCCFQELKLNRRKIASLIAQLAVLVGVLWFLAIFSGSRAETAVRASGEEDGPATRGGRRTSAEAVSSGADLPGIGKVSATASSNLPPPTRVRVRIRSRPFRPSPAAGT